MKRFYSVGFCMVLFGRVWFDRVGFGRVWFGRDVNIERYSPPSVVDSHLCEIHTYLK